MLKRSRESQRKDSEENKKEREKEKSNSKESTNNVNNANNNPLLVAETHGEDLETTPTSKVAPEDNSTTLGDLPTEPLPMSAFRELLSKRRDLPSKSKKRYKP